MSAGIPREAPGQGRKQIVRIQGSHRGPSRGARQTRTAPALGQIYRNRRLGALAEELGREHGIEAEWLEGDLTKTSTLERLRDLVEEGGVGVDLLVCRFFFMEGPRNREILDFQKYMMEEKADEEVGRILREEVDAGRILPCDIREFSRLINVLRCQWCYRVSILDWDEGYDPERSKRYLDPVIRFFEGLYCTGGNAPVSGDKNIPEEH
ncbi:MAG: hypothetical protein GX430_03935 [Treponema sp.]|nr:hypothetical protein [Treponema sp.]